MNIPLEVKMTLVKLIYLIIQKKGFSTPKTVSPLSFIVMNQKVPASRALPCANLPLLPCDYAWGQPQGSGGDPKVI